ncbi:MAG: FKBP-type peptidyl-prolyl cis-trans isomerase [Candidatus Levybacteria bacterium]|nr:FKBP-type peptidyl-prolyl cis-trans isomerase [Candidatus Levybacteria bacterium]
MFLRIALIVIAAVTVIGIAIGFITTALTPKSSNITTASGLKIEDITVGKGVAVQSGDFVVIHYIGKLENGNKFDSSYDKGQPFETQIGTGQVIKGWDEGVVGMRIGGKRRLIIPPSLGYGTQGVGGVIPPNATLFFEVELIDIKK